jgi:capsular exopolysaccharide synthesis family protein
MRGKRSGLVDPGAPSSEAFRTLRLALHLRSETRSGNIVLVTSAEPGTGKTTVASNYALVSSLGHGRVLLIDGDLRKPSIHTIFDVPRLPGLVEALAVDTDPLRFVRNVSGVGHLDILTSGRQIPRSSDLAASSRMHDLLQEASDRYDLVVVDSPPVLTVADAEALASHDGVDVVLVVKKTTKRRSVRQAMRRLELIEANVTGLVVNGRGRAAAYSY